MHLEFNGTRLELSETPISIGRKGHGADVEIDARTASRKHALVKKVNTKVFIKDLESANGILLNAKRMVSKNWVEISPEDKVTIASQTFKLVDEVVPVVEETSSPHEDVEKPQVKGISDFKSQIDKKGFLNVGRLSSNDIVFDDPTVTRVHARISVEDKKYYVEDLGSKNKTYINGREVTGKVVLKDSDVVTISSYMINLIEGYKDLRKEKYAIKAVSIQKKYPNNKIGLQNLSMDIPNSSFVALMGPSGCGKSTLLKCLNGDNPATSGEVFIHGLSLRKNFNLIKKKIGYVPQDDIIHKELTVYRTLFYAAKLRLPDDTTNEEINKRINKVITDLNLNQDKEKDIKDVKVGSLSGGQRKRISIAVELLTEPTILFLDEPTSPLDPETIESFLMSLQTLAHSGTTIVMVTHKPEDLNYVDQVIFLGVQGHLVYKGPAQLLTSHFGAENIIQVYSKMSDSNMVKSTYYQKPNAIPYKNSNATDFKRDKPDSLWLQLYWLVSRYFNIKINDKENLLLLLAQPVIIAGLVCLVFDRLQIGVLFLMAISAIWFGVSNAAKEVVGELSVYKRERMYNLNIHTYILSKWMVLALIALVQTIVFVSVIYLNFKFNTYGNFDEVYLRPYGQGILFMFYISFSASLIGLWLSSSLNSTEKVMTVVPIALMPQIMLAGVMTKINNVLVEILSFFTLGRWGTEGFARLQDEASPSHPRNLGSKESVLTSYPSPSNLDPSIKEASGVVEDSASAMDILDLYNQKLIDEGSLIGGALNSFDKNILVIALLNVLFYILIYSALKKKDSI
ncbi:ATP-binding cassette domain-containing protein [Flagellimonas sp. CMM7]|uniref:FHA domain-containing protein n=1 Tax=Flagellimonas sp. CMM7 TaxID=2654676 RepID=UPI0013D63110|nr:ATP-binding cassette domain-containing protein [Flagellimonas sp. CMM7]UII81653.1 ATP-binding cassette domain-containing protein [Flagellimonas sp. CMM7]